MAPRPPSQPGTSPLWLLFSRGELVIRKAERLAAYPVSPDLRSQNDCPANGLGFPESP